MTTESQKTTLSEKLTKGLLDGGVILAIGTALLFITGRAAELGIYKFWGISDVIFSNNFLEIAYFGFLYLKLQLFSLFIDYWIWVLIVFFFALFYIYLKYKYKDAIEEKIKTIVDKRCPDWLRKYVNEFETSIDKTYKIHMILWTLISVIVGLVFVTALFIHLGEKSAEKTYIQVKNNKYPNLLQIDGSTAYLISCDEKKCAAFYPKRDLLEIIDKDSVTGASRDLSYLKKRPIQENLDGNANPE